MRYSTIIFVILSLLSVLAACGQPAPTPSPATAVPPPSPTKPTASITLTTNPDPPASGEVELIVTVTDESGQPVNDAVIFVTADHTDMTGMGMTGNATGQGNGKYALKANFSMSGNWKFTVQVKKPPLDVSQQVRLSFK